MPSWRCVTLSGAGPAPEELIARLHEKGSLGAEVREGLVLAYFPAEFDAIALMADLARASSTGLRLESCEPVEDGRWHERWLERLAPIRVGRRFWIVPGKEPPRDLEGRHVLRVTPGQAFGTGEHPTTRMCLEMIEDEIHAGWSLLDVGTGSGILAIAGRMLGAAPVLGIDTDESAVQVACLNTAACGVSGVLLAVAGAEELLPRRFDLVVANLDASTLVRLMDRISSLAGRSVIVSGILRGQCRQVEAAAARAGLSRVAVRRGDEWVAMLLERDIA